MPAVAGVAGPTGALAEVTQEMTTALIALAEAWKTYNVAVAILSLFVSAALVAGGIMCLKLRMQGRNILAATFAVEILLKVLRGVVLIANGMATRQITREFMPKIMQAINAGAHPMPARTADIATSIGEAAMLFGFVLGITWLLLNIGFFIGGSIYLRKPDVRVAFRS